MAININKYVSISTQFPAASATQRAFGGLVFTASDMIEPESASDPLQIPYKSYTEEGVAYLTLSQVGDLFGTEVVEDGVVVKEASPEYRFAQGYYGFVSPFGTTPSILAFAKVGSDGPVAAFNRLIAKTNLFGSFTVLSTPTTPESSGETPAMEEYLVDLAAANTGLNAKFLFVVNRPYFKQDGTPRSPEDITSECQKFASANGTVFVAGASDVSAYMPMAILASTDYSVGVTSYMFRQFSGEEATVLTDSEYETFNAARVNFYGRTQTNGQTLDFYQRGYNTDGKETSIYANEMWFKSACETALFQMLTTQNRLPANEVGVGFVGNTVARICGMAVTNGVFMPKDVDTADATRLTQFLSGQNEGVDADTVLGEIGRKGYSLVARLQRFETGEPYISYSVFYGTADSIRFIQGNNVLI